jgi:hypothetical protein
MADPIPNFASLTAIYRHYAPNRVDRWYYDTNEQAYGWSDGHLAFFAYGQQAPDTIPIYQHHAGPPDRYIYDDNPNDHDGWSGTKVWFYAYKRDNPRRPSNTVPIYVHVVPGVGYYYDTYPDPSGTIVFYACPRPRNLLGAIMPGRHGAVGYGSGHWEAADRHTEDPMGSGPQRV